MARKGRRVSRGTPRKKIWVRHNIGQSALAAGAGAYSLPLLGFETAYGAQLLGVTIMRIRMDLYIDGPFTSNGLLYGVRVCTADVVADLAPAPAQAPGSMPNADWMAYGFLTVGATGGLSHVEEVDVRSMRKLDELNQTLLLAVENVGSDSVNWAGQMSILVALP